MNAFLPLLKTTLIEKKTKGPTANVLPLLLSRYFSFSNSEVLLVGAKKYFLPQGAGYPLRKSFFKHRFLIKPVPLL